MISIRTVATTKTPWVLASVGSLKTVSFSSRKFAGICFTSVRLFFFTPFGRNVVLEVKAFLIVLLLPADRSTENLEAGRIQRCWSVVICPLRDDTYSLPGLLNIRTISRPEMTEVKITGRYGNGGGKGGLRERKGGKKHLLCPPVDEQSTKGPIVPQ